MEDKKNVKIRLLTGLLIIALIVIVILSIYIYTLLKRNNSVEEMNSILENNNFVEETNKISDNNDILTQVENDDLKAKGTTLSQLPGDFYDIEAIIKEKKQKDDIKNYKDFEFDLDADGKIDKVTLRHIVNENEEIDSSESDYYTLEYNGENIYSHWGGMGSVGIVDLDDKDNLLEIWVYDDGPSDDPCYYFFRKVGNKIIKMGGFGVGGSFFVDGKGKVVAAGGSMPWIEPSVYDCYYTIENNIFKKNELDFSYNKDFEYTSDQGFFTTNLENLKKFENERTVGDGNPDLLIATGKKYNINKLEANTKFKIIEFVEKANEYDVTDLKIVLADGTIGYLIHPYGRFYLYD